MYKYEEEKPWLFLESKQRDFLEVRDRVKRLLKTAGAVRMHEAIVGMTSCSSFFLMACVDRLKETGELIEITASNIPGQFRVFISGHSLEE